MITALRFSPDGKTLAVSGNREVLLHHADGSGLVKRLPGRADRILSIAFSADGNLMIAGGGTPARFGEIQFWEPREGKLLRAAEATSDTVFGASLSPDASKVAVGCADNTVRAFDTATGKELYKISAHENWVLGTAFGIDSKRLVSVGRDRAAKLIDAERRTVPGERQPAARRARRRGAASESGRDRDRWRGSHSVRVTEWIVLAI